MLQTMLFSPFKYWSPKVNLIIVQKLECNHRELATYGMGSLETGYVLSALVGTDGILLTYL